MLECFWDSTMLTVGGCNGGVQLVPLGLMERSQAQSRGQAQRIM